MITINEQSYSCPIEVAMNLIAGKWKLLILWHLRHKKRRFGELQRKVENVTQKMLTQQLRELERDGLIKRTVYAEVPPRVEYELTKFGETLVPVLNQLLVWGHEYASKFGEVSYDIPASIEPEFRKEVHAVLNDGF